MQVLGLFLKDRSPCEFRNLDSLQVTVGQVFFSPKKLAEPRYSLPLPRSEVIRSHARNRQWNVALDLLDAWKTGMTRIWNPEKHGGKDVCVFFRETSKKNGVKHPLMLIVVAKKDFWSIAMLDDRDCLREYVSGFGR